MAQELCFIRLTRSSINEIANSNNSIEVASFTWPCHALGAAVDQSHYVVILEEAGQFHTLRTSRFSLGRLRVWDTFL